MFIISEISPQHGPDLDVAEQLILQSKLGGANAVKVQLYDTLMFFDNPSEYLLKRELNFNDFKRLKEYGDKVGIPVFATAFDLTRLQWCSELGQKYYKVAARMHEESPELVENILSRPEKIFISVPEAFNTSVLKQQSNYIYFYCISNYPTLLEDVNLPFFSDTIYDGFSDHSLGISAALLAQTRGCMYLEKHMTINHNLQKSIEKAHTGSMDYDELLRFKKLSKELEILLAD